MLDTLCLALMTHGSLSLEDKRVVVHISEAHYRAELFRLDDNRLFGIINGKLFLGNDAKYLETVCDNKSFEKEMEKLK
jgi:hypothetical protein